MTTTEIEEFLQIEYKKKRNTFKIFPKDVLIYIHNHTIKYNWTGNMKLNYIFNVMKCGYTELPICPVENCNHNVKIAERGTYLTKGCCIKHSALLVNREKYGCDFANQSMEIKNKVRLTFLERYGVEHQSQMENFISNRKKTNLLKYGCEEVLSKNSEFRIVGEQTRLKKFGNIHAMKNETVKANRKLTNLTKYGVPEVLASTEIIEKIKKTKIIKYGIDNLFKLSGYASDCLYLKYGVHSPAHIEYIFKKMQTGRFKRKEYMWKTGEISIVQGYEPIVLKELEEKGYTFQDIKTSSSDMPAIWYEYENKNHRYYPDIYIPKENLIIEVKSEWTMIGNFEVNLLKAVATKSQGFDFKLEVR